MSERQLYPFLYKNDDPDDGTVRGALAAVRASTLQKARDVVALREQLLAEYADELVACARAMARAFDQGGKLLAFGNGGSATDAQDAATDCIVPPVASWRPLPALALSNDAATLTAVANDVGFENVFLRQVIAYGAPGDVALGVSTSGNSGNVLAALAEAKRRRLLTVGLAGNDGGAMAAAELDYCFIARTDYVPRIQEGHATIWHTLLELVQAELGGV
jgi:D-sedoheptulose 7-phosphate isomerase